ncbi:MAG: S41 family peptidase [Candidatus Saccharibacteria bacterium]|nr:S41 family peptidase [Candidatus Saccharibacteria bacterium]
MARKHVKTVKHTPKHKSEKNLMNFKVWPGTWFVLIALFAAIGYVAGVYHYQIESTIGPVFGYNAHSGSIDLSSVQQTYNQLAANFDGKLDTAALIQGANKGLVDAAGDTYTVYMSPQESTDYNNNLSGDIGGGIGAEIGIKNNQPTIIRVLPNNAAINAGLQANDAVLNVNGQSTSGMSVDKVVSLVRGKPDTTVKLTIKRGDTVKDYTITRKTINNPSVESSIVNGIGIITIIRFDSETGSLAKQAAQDFKNHGVKAVILDLRNNGGGFVNAATDVAGLWLDNKIVVTERNGAVIRDTLRTGDNAILKDVPTVVLVNSNTASASEIVAGALRDYHQAKLVGDRTYGKGSVQELITLNGGAQLKVTTAKWFTPNSVNISKEGIKPDVTVGLTQADIDNGTDPQLDAAKKLLGL